MAQKSVNDNIYIKIEKKDIAFINSVFESTERFAVFRTIDANKGVSQLLCSPFFIDEVNELIEYLKGFINIEKIDESYLIENNVNTDKEI